MAGPAAQGHQNQVDVTVWVEYYGAEVVGQVLEVEPPIESWANKVEEPCEGEEGDVRIPNLLFKHPCCHFCRIPLGATDKGEERSKDMVQERPPALAEAVEVPKRKVGA